jgi:hypothetical protein
MWQHRGFEWDSGTLPQMPTHSRIGGRFRNGSTDALTRPFAGLVTLTPLKAQRKLTDAL